jgi:hypothetical protein
MSKKKKYCPACQQKDRLIAKLETQLRNYEIKAITN